MTGLLQMLAVAILLQGPVDPSSDSAPRWSIHTVLPGDSIERLAKRYSVDGGKLRAWNDLSGSKLVVGRRLKVLSAVRSVERFRMRYKVRKETTWRALANRYQMRPKTLLALNKRKGGGKVPVGKRVTVYVTKDRWNRTWLDGGILLEERPGLKVKEAKWSWGRPVAVRTIEVVADAISDAFPGSAMVVGDLSYQRGGAFPPHDSHRAGLDADIGFFIPNEPFTMKFKHKKPGDIDAQRTWFLVRSLLETKRVQKILVDWYIQSALYEQAKSEGISEEQLEEWFQYPRKRWEQEGTIRHYKGHKNHLHIRFIEPEDGVLL
jgi:LysM repeat protein